MGRPEQKIEKHACKGVTELGGLALKFVIPGRRGANDRIIVWPDGYVSWVEFKSPRGRTSVLQDDLHEKLRKRNVTVYIVDSKTVADWWLHGHKNRLERLGYVCTMSISKTETSTRSASAAKRRKASATSRRPIPKQTRWE